VQLSPHDRTRGPGSRRARPGPRFIRERLTMLCDDHDFETVAAVTGQPVKRVTEPFAQ